MTYLPENIFKNILAYCDDRIERKQKELQSKVNKSIIWVRIQSKCIYRGGEKIHLLRRVDWFYINYIYDRTQKLKDLYINDSYIMISPHSSLVIFGEFNGNWAHIDNHFSNERNLLCPW